MQIIFRLTRIVLLIGVAVLVGCAPTLRTQVVTLSDRPPTASATYRIELSDKQVGDLEVTRLTSQIHARMSHAGFVKAPTPDTANVTVRFELNNAGMSSAPTSAGPGVSIARGTTVGSSQTSIASLPVPLTRSRNVTHSRSHEASMGSEPPVSSPITHTYRFDLMFADDEGPSHKVSVAASVHGDAMRELAPCLVQAAFEGFPRGDGQEAEVVVRTRECRAS